jgi:hypothetical protein
MAPGTRKPASDARRGGWSLWPPTTPCTTAGWCASATRSCARCAPGRRHWVADQLAESSSSRRSVRPDSGSVDVHEAARLPDGAHVVLRRVGPPRARHSPAQTLSEYRTSPVGDVEPPWSDRAALPLSRDGRSDPARTPAMAGEAPRSTPVRVAGDLRRHSSCVRSAREPRAS